MNLESVTASRESISSFPSHLLVPASATHTLGPNSSVQCVGVTSMQFSRSMG